jgi:hypothetical protein
VPESMLLVTDVDCHRWYDDDGNGWMAWPLRANSSDNFQQTTDDGEEYRIGRSRFVRTIVHRILFNMRRAHNEYCYHSPAVQTDEHIVMLV